MGESLIFRGKVRLRSLEVSVWEREVKREFAE